jgi:hypothetical protein
MFTSVCVCPVRLCSIRSDQPHKFLLIQIAATMLPSLSFLASVPASS